MKKFLCCLQSSPHSLRSFFGGDLKAIYSLFAVEWTDKMLAVFLTG